MIGDLTRELLLAHASRRSKRYACALHAQDQRRTRGRRPGSRQVPNGDWAHCLPLATQLFWGSAEDMESNAWCDRNQYSYQYMNRWRPRSCVSLSMVPYMLLTFLVVHGSSDLFHQSDLLHIYYNSQKLYTIRYYQDVKIMIYYSLFSVKYE